MKTKISAILIAETLFRTVLFLSLTCIGFFANFCNLHCIYSLSYSSLSLLLSLALPSLPISAILIAQTLCLSFSHTVLSQLACAKRSAEENGHTYPNLSELQRKRAQSKGNSNNKRQWQQHPRATSEREHMQSAAGERSVSVWE